MEQKEKEKQEKVNVATNDLPFLELIVIIAPRATIPFFPIHPYAKCLHIGVTSFVIIIVTRRVIERRSCYRTTDRQ